MILIIDDDSAIRTSLSFMLKRAKYEVQAVATPKEAMAVVRSVCPELILMDMNFSLTTSGDEGITLLKQVKLFQPDAPVILMTAWGSIDLAVKGMQAGAFDFVTKPWNNAALMQRIETALELNARKEAPKEVDEEGFDRSHIIGKSKALMDVLETIKRMAHSGGVCVGCVHMDDEPTILEQCEDLDFDCEKCPSPCACHSCKEGSNYTWRGAVSADEDS